MPDGDAFFDQRRPGLSRKLKSTGERPHRFGERIVGRALARWRRYRPRSSPGAIGVGQRQHHLDQRDTIGVAMMDAHDQCAAAVEAFDQVKPPQRPAGIERCASQRADEGLELRLSGAARQHDSLQVIREIELVVGLPVAACRGLQRALTKAPEAQKAVGQRLVQPRERDALAKNQHAANHHQIARPIHPQPCGVDTGHAFALVAHRCGILPYVAQVALK
jgi:hypothetical protein